MKYLAKKIELFTFEHWVLFLNTQISPGDIEIYQHKIKNICD